MTAFAFNFQIDDQDGGNDYEGDNKLTVKLAATPVPQPQAIPVPPLQHLSLADAYPVCEDGVVDTVESIQSPSNRGITTNEVSYYSQDEVLLWAKANGLISYLMEKINQEETGAESGSTDLISGVYEGGFQLWECAIDLVHWLMGPGAHLPGVCGPGLRVAELGCGGGVPGLCCLRCFSPQSVTFQDFNSEVLRAWTMPNCQLNLSALAESSTPGASVDFLSGSWDTIAADEHLRGAFDLVLTSETIYNPSYYSQLHSALCHTLSLSGQALVSAKMSYFGVGGSVPMFTEYLDSMGVFKHEVVHQTDGAALVRVIIRLTRIEGI